MKRLLIIAFIILFAGTSYAGTLQEKQLSVLAKKNAAAPACTTPTTADVLHEGFLGAGYENTWTESITAGATVDEDFTLSGTPPARSCTEGLNTVMPGAHNAYTRWDNGSAIDSATVNLDIEADLYIDSFVVDDITNIKILHWDTDTTQTTTGTASVVIYRNDGTGGYKFLAEGAANSAAISYSEDTWYSLKLHLDTTANQSYLSIGGDVACAAGAADTATCKKFTRNDTDGRYLMIGPMSNQTAGESGDIEWGYVGINTP